MTTETATVDEFDRERLVAIAQRTVDINAALDRLVRDFRGIFNRETIERFIYDSAARLGEAKVRPTSRSSPSASRRSGSRPSRASGGGC